MKPTTQDVDCLPGCKETFDMKEVLVSYPVVCKFVHLSPVHQMSVDERAPLSEHTDQIYENVDDNQSTPRSHVATPTVSNNGGLFLTKDRKGSPLSHHPFAIYLIISWIIFVAVTIANLEYTVWNTNPVRIEATQSVAPDWLVDRMPTTLLILFAQGHVPITSVYLSRLGASALQRQATTARSWAELFWIADRSWQGPFGLITVMLDSIRLRNTKLSRTIILFAVTCAFAFPAPIVFSRAYGIDVVTAFLPFLASVGGIDTQVLATLPQERQLIAGAGFWSTGERTIWLAHRSYAYSPWNPSFDDNGFPEPYDTFAFSSRILALNVAEGNQEATDQLTMRVQAGCSINDLSPRVDPALNLYDETSFWRWCRRQSFLTKGSSSLQIVQPGIVLSTQWCSTHNVSDRFWTLNPASALDQALLRINVTLMNGTRTAFLECSSTFELGKAFITTGTDGSYFHSFASQEVFSRNDLFASTWFTHPLTTALLQLTSDTTKRWTDIESLTRMFPMYGLRPWLWSNFEADFWAWQAGNETLAQEWSPEARNKFQQAILLDIKDSIELGTFHMGAALATLSHRQVETNVTYITGDLGRTRNLRLAVIAWILVGAWAAMLLYCTKTMYRKTYAPSLNSYAAARLLVDRPGLVDGHCCGELAQNKNLREPFLRVGDAAVDHETGHISVGGEGNLDSNRMYAGR